MKKIFLLLVPFFLLASALFAQIEPLFINQKNAKWTVHMTDSGFSPFQQDYYYYYDLVKDSVICGKKYKYFKSKENSLGEHFFIRNEGKKTYLNFGNCSDEDLLLYDFSEDFDEVGESIVINNPIAEQMTIDLLDIDSMLIDGKQHKVYDVEVVKDKRISKMKWIEGIGSTVHPFFYFHYPFLTDIGRYTLLCYEDNGMTKYKKQGLQNCYYERNIQPFPTISDKIVWTFAHYKFLPYPTKDTLKIEGAVKYCGKDYQKIKLFNSNQGYYYFRNEGNKTFCRKDDNCKSEEFLFYDFDLNKGDTMVVNADLGLKVLSVDSTTNYGWNRKVMKMQYFFRQNKKNLPTQTMTWVQGFGAIDTNVHPFYFAHLYPELADPQETWKPFCYYYAGYRFFSNSTNYCDIRPAEIFPFPLAKSGLTWSINAYILGLGSSSNTTFKLDAPTEEKLICGKTYSNYKNKLFYRNEYGRTMMRTSSDCASPEVIMYDFMTAYVGKTYDVPSLIDDNIFKFKVVKIDTLNGFFQRRRIHLKYKIVSPSEMEMMWIEGVGSSEHPFYPVEPIWRHVLDGPKFEVICEHQQIYQVYQNPKYTKCDLTSPTKDAQEADNYIVIFPNPTQNAITVTTTSGQKGELILTNLLGQVIDFQFLNESGVADFDLSHFPKGIYTLTLRTVEGTISKKVVLE